ncbi:SDR family oxidoreductase [Fibrobacterota bacterium]
MKGKNFVNTDMSGRICLVTGANSGIGKQVCFQLARLHATVIMACRNETDGRNAQKEIVRQSGKSNIFLEVVDLSSQKSIRYFVEKFLKEYEQLHVLVNNAGIYMQERRESVDGIELTFATNVLGYFLLSNSLIELLKSSAPSRIIHVVSSFAGRLSMNDLEGRKKYDGQTAYMQSKQANRMVSHYQAELLKGTGLTVNCTSPGLTKSGLFRNYKGFFTWIVKLMGKDPADAADTIVWLAASDKVQEESGKLWENRKEQKRKFSNPVKMEQLWNACSEMTKR